MQALKDSFVWHCKEIIARLEEAELQRDPRLGDIFRLTEALEELAAELGLRSPPLQILVDRRPHDTNPALVTAVYTAQFVDPTGEGGRASLISVEDERSSDGIPVGEMRYANAELMAKTRAGIKSALTCWIRFADRTDFGNAAHEGTAGDDATANKQAVSVRIEDRRGQRVLVIPSKEVGTYSGRLEALAGIIRDIEAHTGTRLRDGENPLWFLRLNQHFKDRRDPHANISFTAFCEDRHPDKVERMSTSRHESSSVERSAIPNDESQSSEVAELVTLIRELVSHGMQPLQDMIRRCLESRVAATEVDRLIPFDAERVLTLDEKTLVLAAIHDYYAGPLARVNPWAEHHKRYDADLATAREELGPVEWQCWLAYSIIVREWPPSLPSNQLWIVRELIDDVGRDLARQAAASKPATVATIGQKDERFSLVHRAGIDKGPPRFDKPCGSWRTSCWPADVNNPEAVVQWLDYVTAGKPNPLSFQASWKDQRPGVLPRAEANYLHDAFWAVTELARHQSWGGVPTKPASTMSLDEVRHELLRLRDWIREKTGVETAHTRRSENGPTGSVARPLGDLLTTDELAKLAMVDRKTLLNRLSKSRKPSYTGVRPPNAVAGDGNQADRYSYAEIRPWLCDQWEDRTFCFPELFAEARKILADR